MTTQANCGLAGWREVRDREHDEARSASMAEYWRQVEACEAWLPGEYGPFVHAAVCRLRTGGWPITRPAVLAVLRQAGRDRAALELVPGPEPKTRPRAAAGHPEDATETVTTTLEG